LCDCTLWFFFKAQRAQPFSVGNPCNEHNFASDLVGFRCKGALEVDGFGFVGVTFLGGDVFLGGDGFQVTVRFDLTTS
jgi:hypothetical protein